ncbi:hypothetical protein [Streptomyces chilikensis]|uniref:Uncharacterized protein n=1 Tax=Streptomyces chilikensis TaxID=1194079 RepID=A0ABV3EY24_9ACTN
MSRRRIAVRDGGMPDWLREYRPEQWASDLDDPLEVYYFGRYDWQKARSDWLAGLDPVCKIQNPQTRPEGERQH